MNGGKAVQCHSITANRILGKRNLIDVYEWRVCSEQGHPQVLAGWCNRTGGRVAHFTVRNRCNPPRRAHQLASAREKCNNTGKNVSLKSAPDCEGVFLLSPIETARAAESIGIRS